MDVSELTTGGEASGSFPHSFGGGAKDFVRGSINNRPFRPGGLDDQSLERILPDGASNGEWVREVLNGGPAQTIPPGFKQGLNLGDLRVIVLNKPSKMIFFLLSLLNHKVFYLFVSNSFTFSILKAHPCSWNVYKDQSASDNASVEKLVSFLNCCLIFVSRSIY